MSIGNTKRKNAMNKYKTLALNTVIFAIGSFGSKILLFFLTRLYTGNIISDNLNTKELLEITANFLIPVFTFSIAEAVIRYGIDRAYDKRRVFSNAVVTELGGLVLLLLCTPLIGLFSFTKGFLALLIIYICTSSFRQLCAQFVRARGLLKLYSVDGILTALTLYLFNVLFISVLGMGVRGFMLSVICSDFCSGVFLCIVSGIPRFFSFRYVDKKLLRRMLAFSVPLIPTAVLWIFTGFADRFFIGIMHGPEGLVGKSAAGVYGAASKIPNLISMVSTIFFQAWNISAITENDSAGRNQFYQRIFGAYQSILCIAAAFLIALVQPLSNVLISNKLDTAYEAAFRYTPVLVVSVLLMCFNQFLSSIYTATQHTRNSFWTSLVAAGVNLPLNLLMIPKWGVYGAIAATYLSYLLCYIVRIVDARRYVPFRVNHLLFAANNVILLGMSTAIIKMPQRYVLYLVCGVGLILALNYEAVIVTAKKILKR